MQMILYPYSSILMKPLEMRENHRKIKGRTFKITNIPPAMCSGVSNLVPNQCLDKVLLPYGRI